MVAQAGWVTGSPTLTGQMDEPWGWGHRGYLGSRSHDLRGNKDPSLPPHPWVWGNPRTHQPTRLAGNRSGRRLPSGGLSTEGGVPAGVPGSPPPSSSPYPSSTYGTHPRPRAPNAASNRKHLRPPIATWHWMVTAHPLGATALAQRGARCEVVRTHFQDEENEVQTGLVARCPRSPSQ